MTTTQNLDARSATASYTVPGVEKDTAAEIATSLQQRLNDLNELHLTLKHAHWNVQGPNFIAVHEMLDPQIDAIRAFADEVAERIVTLGFPAVGTPGALVAARDHDDYNLLFANTSKHLEEIDAFYDRVILGFRESIDLSGELDKITEDVLIGQSRELEKFQWFVRAHLEK
ncbi:DNA starvation/stationary phase protection protein Dps [Gulosibacter faecalis]|uniref:DNA starvation/stationary phase protection protein Dps n=1 Tax=Gulosibacter faecalis TaxID=272240 RepID=A0ABW5V2M8_9MICO|nr:DNA starvation/stationary phase protection protein Dps [Gulosibacter faecalis]